MTFADHIVSMGSRWISCVYCCCCC